MKNFRIDPNNPASVAAFLVAFREHAQAEQSAYLGMIDKVPDALKPQVQALKENVDKVLTALAGSPTTMVPAANEAAWSLSRMCDALGWLQELYASSQASINKLLAEYGPKETQLCALNQKLQRQELLSLEEVDKRVKDAVKAAEDKFALLSARRSELLRDNLPMPATDEALGGDAASFTALKTRLTERTKTLKDKGLLAGLDASEQSQLLYAPDAQFNQTVKLAEKAAGSRKPEPEPLLGGGGDGSAPRMAF